VAKSRRQAPTSRARGISAIIADWPHRAQGDRAKRRAAGERPELWYISWTR